MLLAYARLAETYDMHLVSDEVYALSVFKNHREWPRVPSSQKRGQRQ